MTFRTIGRTRPRRPRAHGGRLRAAHPHTKTGKHLLRNGRQWGDAEPHIPDMALDFIYGYHSNESLRQTMAYTSTGDITYIAGGTVVTYIHAGGADDDGDAVDADQPHRQCAYFGENISCNNDFTCLALHTDGTRQRWASTAPAPLCMSSTCTQWNPFCTDQHPAGGRGCCVVLGRWQAARDRGHGRRRDAQHLRVGVAVARGARRR